MAAPVDDKVKVALLVPLSGDGAELGQSLLHAAELALFEAPDANVALIVRDSGGSPLMAAQAAGSAIKAGAQLVLGPVFGNAVRAVAPVAERSGVNVVSFSTDTGAARPGVYVMGILPSLQVERVVGFAARQGLRRVAALLPQSTYGRVVNGALQSAARRSKASIVRVDYYDPRLGDVSGSVGVLGQYVAGGAAVDALLIPEGGDRLRGIAQQLGSFGIDTTRVRLLGSTLWEDDPGLGGDPVLVGGWFAAPEPDAWQRFRGRYRAAFGGEPARLASLAYDATLLAVLLANATNGADFSTTALTDAAGFSGVDGIFRFRQNGTVERGLAILELREGRPELRESAPQSFDDLIY